MYLVSVEGFFFTLILVVFSSDRKGSFSFLMRGVLCNRLRLYAWPCPCVWLHGCCLIVFLKNKY